jgi:predicted metal-dependent hydrolase
VVSEIPGFDYPSFFCADGTELPVSARISKRARSNRVILSHKGELEVVISSRRLGAKRALEPNQIATFLEEKRLWIERTARRIAPHIENHRQGLAAGLPTHLDFPPLGELWHIEYHPTAAARITAKRSNTRSTTRSTTKQATSKQAASRHTTEYTAAAPTPTEQNPKRTLCLHGNIENEEACFEALRRFVTSYAKEQLPFFAWRTVGELEAAYQLKRHPKDITVNNRKSAWGVCTHDGHIRIDRRVIFLPTDLARQIILHELAHLTHLNHGQAFYEELYSYEGATHEAEKAVKKATQYVPAWF